MMNGKRTMMTTREAVNEFLRRLATDDAAHVAALFAEEVDFLCAGSEAVPWIRPRRTRADMADFFATMHAAFVPEDRSASLSLFLVDGLEAVVMGHVSQRLRANGVAFTIPFALRLTVVNGQIIRYHIYEDSLTVADAVKADGAGPRPDPAHGLPSF
jgi:ketosteroid isomerase-like protein